MSTVKRGLTPKPTKNRPAAQAEILPTGVEADVQAVAEAAQTSPSPESNKTTGVAPNKSTTLVTDGNALRLIPIEVFDSQSYIEANPDVARAVKAGEFASVYEHYCLHGAAEGRPLRVDVIGADMPVVYEYPPDHAQEGTLRSAVDLLALSVDGGIFIVGWADDTAAAMSTVRLSGNGWHVDLAAQAFIRLRRPDVEAALGTSAPYCYGFCGLFHFAWKQFSDTNVTVELRTAQGIGHALSVTSRLVGNLELRDMALSHLATTTFYGNPDVERMLRLASGYGAQAAALNRSITREMVASPYVERFCDNRRRYKGSIVVCLYGKSEFYFLQHALYGGLPGIEDYEFVYVCNSPEISERLLRDAHTARLIYGLPSTVIVLAGNAGFGAANNVAVNHSRSDRALIVNPDVFPRRRDWAAQHTRLLNDLPDEQTKIFGSTLYYDDGSLMHGGMYFESDTALTITGDSPKPTSMLRVEHYGKGAPTSVQTYRVSRPVPAVTGAFISIDRAWYEKLGGFTEDFVFGHYEDADLCLKSLERGYPSWIHDLDLWHLEGKGSTRKLPHEGGSAVNRWLFAQKWGRFLEQGMIGREPSHPLLAGRGAV